MSKQYDHKLAAHQPGRYVCRMHLLSSAHHSEFLSCPQLVRFTCAEGPHGREPTLLLKASNLLLKFVVSGAKMQLLFAPLGTRLLYALKIWDDQDSPATVWSILERSDEIDALQALTSGEPLQFFLFNELAVCVAWAEVAELPILRSLSALLPSVSVGQVEHRDFSDAAGAALNLIHREGAASRYGSAVDLSPDLTWKIYTNSYVTNKAGSSRLELLDPDEGSQQEELIIWLTDSLQPSGAIRSPQIPKGSGTRELTDILLTHKFGSMLIESKALGILKRLDLPARSKLREAVCGHVAKGAGQLRGAIRKLRSGVDVTDPAGHKIDVERDAPPHAIILVPDLDLIKQDDRLGISFMHDFCKDSRGILHVLDPSELLRVVQAAQAIAERDPEVMGIEAFDYLLMKRAERVVQAGHLCISILHQIE